MRTFDFELGEKVQLAMSVEYGVVIGRAEYSESTSTYLVRYLDSTGCQMERWFQAPALASLRKTRPRRGSRLVKRRKAR